jgi:hypothetical protein
MLGPQFIGGNANLWAESQLVTYLDLVAYNGSP